MSKNRKFVPYWLRLEGPLRCLASYIHEIFNGNSQSSIAFR